jgi:hypothetical protein
MSNLQVSDIRARYMIPELINLSNEPTFVLTPSMLIGEEFLSKHQSLKQIDISIYKFHYTFLNTFGMQINRLDLFIVALVILGICSQH